LIKVQNLFLQIGDRVLVEDLSFRVAPGEVVAFMGSSGCGKTSVLKTLTQERPLQKGHVSFEKDWAEIPQDESLNPELSALQNVNVGLLKDVSFWSGFKKIKSEQPRIMELLKVWGLANPDQKVNSLSGGEKQRVCLVRALVTEWKILFADEPISQLDETNAHKVLSALREEAKRRNGSIVWALHQPELARKYSDRILVFDGRGHVQPEGQR
jgi:phosphonate transport system ATP-binding protein